MTMKQSTRRFAAALCVVTLGLVAGGAAWAQKTPLLVYTALETDAMHLDDAGDIGPASALASLIVVTSTLVCIAYSLLTRVLLARTQAWRNLGRG